MRRMRKTVTLLLVGIMAIALISACTSNTQQPAAAKKDATIAGKQQSGMADSSKPDISKEVKLKMYLIGNKPDDYNETITELNKMIKKDINATLDVEFIPSADRNTKIPLLFASGDDFDMIYTAIWANYTQMATRNGFLELTDDMLKKYLPQSFREIPKAAWDQTKVNGKTYMVPGNNLEYNQRVYLIRGDLREKYNVPPLKTVEDLENYLFTVAKNEKSIVAYQPAQTIYMLRENFLLRKKTLEYIGNIGFEKFLAFNYTDSSGKVINIVDTPEYAEYVKRMKNWKDNGVWTRDVLSEKNTERFREGKDAMYVHNKSVDSVYVNVKRDHPEWKPEIYDFSQGQKKLPNLFINNGIGINKNSKNSERALMLVELLRNNRDYFDLTWFGIKGKHFEPVGDKGVKVLKTGGGFAGPWGWNNVKYMRSDVSVPENSVQLVERWKNEETANHPLQAFNFNDEKVKNEMAAVSNIYQQYAVPLELGLIESDKGMATLKDKLKSAGIDKIQQEMQAQVEEYMKTNK